MKLTHTVSLGLLLTGLTNVFAITARTNSSTVIYGEDNRIELFEVTNPRDLRLAKATAGMVPAQFMSRVSEDGFALASPASMQELINLCPEERFGSQPILAVCSGFLINEDTLVTAGHCVGTSAEEQAERCRGFAWVFEMGLEREDYINLEMIQNERVYACKSIVMAKFNEDDDFAIIKLDRKVEGREPLTYRTSGKVSSDAELMVIGHPTMLPLKIARGGSVLENTDHQKFVTTLDSFQGNSGAAVFDVRTGMLEGLLVSGKADYVLSRPDDEKSCKLVNRCNEKGGACTDGTGELVIGPLGPLRMGERVTRITTLQEYL